MPSVKILMKDGMDQQKAKANIFTAKNFKNSQSGTTLRVVIPSTRSNGTLG